MTLRLVSAQLELHPALSDRSSDAARGFARLTDYARAALGSFGISDGVITLDGLYA